MGFLAPIGAAIFGAIGTVASFVGSLGFIGQVALSFGLNWAAQALRGNQEQTAPAAGVSYDVEYGANNPRKVACGLVAMPGQEMYNNTHGESNKWWQRVYKLSDLPVDGLSRVGVDGEWVEIANTETGDRGFAVKTGDAAGYLWIKFYDGRQTVADPGLVNNANPSERWTSTAVGTGCAYVVVTALFDRENFTTFPNLLFEVRGARLYDWRKDTTAGGSGAHRLSDPDTWEFSENPTVIEYNYRLGFSVNGDHFCGMQMSASDLPLDHWTTAANICDEQVDGESRYRASIIFSGDLTHGGVIASLAKNTGGQVINSVSGSWPIIGTDQPIVATLTDDDLVEGSSPVFQAKRSMSKLVNSVSGTFPDPENLWSSTPYDVQTDPALVAQDRRTRDVTLDFPTVRSKRQATQLARMYYSENRHEKTINNYEARGRWRRLEAGDWIDVNSEMWGDATYLVVSRIIKSLGANRPRTAVLNLQERSGDIYTNIGIVSPTVTPPSNQAPVYLQQVQGESVSPVVLNGNDGLRAAGLRVSWLEITDPTVTGVSVQYRAVATPDQVFSKQYEDGQTVAYIYEGVVQTSDYEVRTKLITTGREVTATAWQTVTTSTIPNDDVTVGLSQINDDIRDLFLSQGQSIEELFEEVRLQAANAGTIAAQHTLRDIALAVENGQTRAAVVSEAQARATGDAANASLIQAVEASLGDSLASGQMRIEAQAGAGIVESRIVFMTRVGDAANDDYREAGFALEALLQDGTYTTRAVFQVDQFVISDGTGTHLPFVFEGGVVKLAVANIGTVTAGLLKSPDNLMQIDLTAGSITIDDGV